MAVIDVRAMLARRRKPPFGHVDVSEKGRKALAGVVAEIYKSAQGRETAKFDPNDDGDEDTVQVAKLAGFDKHFQPDARWSLERTVTEIRKKGVPKTLGGPEISEGDWTFYAIRARLKKHDVVVVRAKSPTYGLDVHKKVVARFIGNELRPVEQPLLSFDRFADLMVVDDRVFLFDPVRVEKLFVDAEAVKKRAPQLAQAFGKGVAAKLSAATIDAVERACARSARVGRRVERLTRETDLSRVTAASIRSALSDAGMSKDAFGKGGPISVANDDQAKVLVEIAADLYYQPRHEDGSRRVGSFRRLS